MGNSQLIYECETIILFFHLFLYVYICIYSLGI